MRDVQRLVRTLDDLREALVHLLARGRGFKDGLKREDAARIVEKASTCEDPLAGTSKRPLEPVSIDGEPQESRTVHGEAKG